MLNGWISSILNWRESIRMYADSWGFVNLKLTKSDQMADFWVSSIGELTKRIRFEEVCELLVNCGIDEVGSLIPITFVSPLFPIPIFCTYNLVRAAITLCRVSCRLRRLSCARGGGGADPGDLCRHGRGGFALQCG